MLSLAAIEKIYDYLYLCRSYTRQILDRAQVAPNPHEIKEALITEQRRRERELSRLIDLVGDEMTDTRKTIYHLDKGGGKQCRDETTPQEPPPTNRGKAELTRKEPRPVTDGMPLSSGSGNSAKRRPGRPRKHCPETSE